jgi:hypothetical protein
MNKKNIDDVLSALEQEVFWRVMQNTLQNPRWQSTNFKEGAQFIINILDEIKQHPDETMLNDLIATDLNF